MNMDISAVVRLAKRVHDAEGVNLGASSTRDQRNAFWLRAIGVVHHGHPAYNGTPDPRWVCKSAGSGRPQSDDVTVDTSTGTMYDCIPSAGADNYRFNESPHGEPFPAGQELITPPVPSGGGSTSTPVPVPTPTPPPSSQPVLEAMAALSRQLSQLDARLGLVESAAATAAFEATNAAGRASEIKTQIENLPAWKPFPVYTGRVPTFGGSVTLTPREP
jgi:hypothetical protein